MASIVFNDGAAATLTPFSAGTGQAVASRFRGWKVRTAPVQDVATRLGSGARDSFVFRRAPRADATLEHILKADLGIAERFKYYMEAGGTCTLNTTDAGSRSYSDVSLVEGTEVDISPPDPQTLDVAVTASYEYTGTLTTVTMLCIY